MKIAGAGLMELGGGTAGAQNIAPAADVTLDAAARAEVIDAALRALHEERLRDVSRDLRLSVDFIAQPAPPPPPAPGSILTVEERQRAAPR